MPRWFATLCLLFTLCCAFTFLPAQAAPAGQESAASLAVFGVRGAFAPNQTGAFAYVFTTTDGLQLAVAGSTPAVQQQIAVLSQQQPPKVAQIWGTRYFPPKSTSLPDLVVTEILVEGDQAVPPVSSAAPTAVVNFNRVNLYTNPSQSMAVVGQVSAGESCLVKGRDAASEWLLVDCGGVNGWIDRRLVNVAGVLTTVPVTTTVVSGQAPASAPTPTPPPTPPPTPVDVRGWLVTYFNNPTLQGSPVVYQDVATVDGNWGYGSPSPAVPVDYFSARYERTLTLAQGYYRIFATADDGVRVWVNNDLVIDEWHGATGIQYATFRYLTGVTQFRVEYLEVAGLASLRMGYEYSAQTPPWTADYYNGATARTQLLFSQREPASVIQLDRTWGAAAPVSGKVPADNWNGRWSGQFTFEGGNYLFRARSDDGTRVYIDQTLVIDAWTEGPVDRTNRFLGVGPGPHMITVDYYKRTGNGFLQVWWTRDASTPGLGQ